MADKTRYPSVGRKGLMQRAIAILRSLGDVRPEERVAAGRVGAAVWAIASLSVVAMAVVLPAAGGHRGILIGMGVAGCAWAAFSGLLLDYGRLPVWIIHLSALAGTVSIAAALLLSGDARSPAWVCLFYVVVFAAYFFKPGAAAGYFFACVGVQCLVLLVSPDAETSTGIGRLVIAAPAFVFLGAAVITAKRYMWTLRGEAEGLAAEQGALRRVATAVVEGEPAENFYALVAEEVGGLVGGDIAGVLRIEPGGQAQVLGAWGRSGAWHYQPGELLPLAESERLFDALTSGQPVHLARAEVDDHLARWGYAASAVAPIRVRGRPWGLLTVVADSPEAFGPQAAQRLTGFGDLVATAIASIEDRALLSEQAFTDPLTGVANHRAYQERLVADLARSRRHGRPVSVAVIDVDHFKQVNDRGGHEVGNEMLRRVARALSSAARAEDTIARVGGDEFSWILPETTGDEALAAVQRVREEIVLAGGHGLPRVTISAGIADSRAAHEPADLVRLADRALYASKRNGRDRVTLYDVDTDVTLAGLSGPS